MWSDLISATAYTNLVSVVDYYFDLGVGGAGIAGTGVRVETSAPSGTFRAAETVTWAGGGSGTFVRYDASPDRITLYRTAGSGPAISDVLTGGASGATATVTATTSWTAPAPLRPLEPEETVDAELILTGSTFVGFFRAYGSIDGSNFEPQPFSSFSVTASALRSRLRIDGRSRYAFRFAVRRTSGTFSEAALVLRRGRSPRLV